jgi:subtilisin family serine protease
MARYRATASFVLAVLVIATMFTPVAAHAAPGPTEAPQWWFDAWNVPELWAAGADGRGITIAVVDTGVQASIPELSGQVLPGADLIGNGTDGRTDFDVDAFSHGTAMASIIVGRKGYGNIEGLAPEAKVLPISVPLQGVIRLGGPPKPNATATAVRYAADHGAKVINMSLGEVVYEGQDDAPCSSELQDAIVYALQRGSLVVAASGNSGEEGSPVDEPGVCLGVVSVGAVDANSDVTSFSSRHPYLTVTAPGADIPTLTKVTNQAFVGSGTSQATAMTSAALALIWSKFPTASNAQILSRLLGSVHDRGAKGRDDLYGLGVIDPNAAIKANAAAAKSNAVFTGVQPLLALATIKPQQPRALAAAGRTDAPIGTVQIGSVATTINLAIVVTSALALMFGLLAVVLLVLALRRNSRPVVLPVSR